MKHRLVCQPSVNWGLWPFWVGINAESYGCPGLGHRGVKLCLELGVVELMVCIGRRYAE